MDDRMEYIMKEHIDMKNKYHILEKRFDRLLDRFENHAKTHDAHKEPIKVE